MKTNPLNIDNYNDVDDEKLIKNALKGDKTSLNNLLEKHQGYIFNIAMKMMNGVSDAEDITQEILIKLVVNLAKYDASKSRFRTWLYRITFNHILNVKKSSYEQREVTFSKFFNFIDNVENITMTEEEEPQYIGDFSIREAQVACTAGMLMCLSREQRLIYIVGEVFEIDHNLAAEIFEITPVNFRKKLSRTRKDLYEWMNKRCGLVNKNNPCRCRNKTKKFIEMGIVNPENKKWHSNYRTTIFEQTNAHLNDFGQSINEMYAKLYKDVPFKKNLKANDVYNEILNNKKFSQFMNL